MNQKSSFRENPQFVSGGLTGNIRSPLAPLRAPEGSQLTQALPSLLIHTSFCGMSRAVNIALKNVSRAALRFSPERTM